MPKKARMKRNQPLGPYQRKRKMAMIQHGVSQQDVADLVAKRTGTPVTRQAVGNVMRWPMKGGIRSRRIEEAFADLVQTNPEKLGWPHAAEDRARAKIAAKRVSYDTARKQRSAAPRRKRTAGTPRNGVPPVSTTRETTEAEVRIPAKLSDAAREVGYNV